MAVRLVFEGFVRAVFGIDLRADADQCLPSGRYAHLLDGGELCSWIVGAGCRTVRRPSTPAVGRMPDGLERPR